jgi:hypothetical protein
MLNGTRRTPAQALKRKDPVKYSRTRDDASALLIEALEQLVTLLVEFRRGGVPVIGLYKLGLLAQLFYLPYSAMPTDAAIKCAMAEIGRRLARRLDYQKLHDTIERIAGNPDSIEWGQRFTPIASSLNGAVTRDGMTWCT